MDASTTDASGTSLPMLGILRGLLLLEAAATLAVTIYLSMLAAGNGADETTIRFAAGGTIIVAILAAFASRGVRRRRGSAWTLAAMLQVVIAIGTGVGILVSEWHPLFLIGFALPTLVMLVLSTSAVRRALGQA
jgi:hypothetical protein